MSDNATKAAHDDAEDVLQDLVVAACELAEAVRRHTGRYGVSMIVEATQFRVCAGELATVPFSSVSAALHRILEKADSNFPLIATINLLISRQQGAALPPVYTVLFKIAAFGNRSDNRSLIRFAKKLAKATSASLTVWLEPLKNPARQLAFVITMGGVETFRGDRNCTPSRAQLAEVERWWANQSFNDRLIVFWPRPQEEAVH